jgi:hypothetical protein
VPTGSLIKISIRDSAALVLLGASKAAALVASTLPTNVRRAILFMVNSLRSKVSEPGAVATGSSELLLSLNHWIIDSMNE